MIRSILHEHSDGFTIERVQDCEPILDRNKALQNERPNRLAELRLAASIPLVVVEKWMNEEGINIFDPNHAEAVRRKLNSRDYLWLRTDNSRL